MAVSLMGVEICKVCDIYDTNVFAPEQLYMACPGDQLTKFVDFCCETALEWDTLHQAEKHDPQHFLD